MTENSHSEFSEQSWFSRISGAIKGVVIGLIMFLIAFPLLFWNEGRAVDRYQTLKEGLGAVVSTTIDKVDTSKDKQLVYVSGKVETKEELADPTFGISMNAIKIKRVVEMYQWKETRSSKSSKSVGGSKQTKTTYSYNKGWHKKHISSDKFKKSSDYKNPSSMPYSNKEWTAKDVSLGAYTLSNSLTSKINNYTALPIETGSAIPAELQGKAQVHSSAFYIGNAPETPVIGDCKISFKAITAGDYSIVSKQINNSFEPYQTSVGGTIELLQNGIVTAEIMFKAAQDQNTKITWGIRFGGFILMLIGLVLILNPLGVFADVLPILGSIVGVGTGIIAFLLSGFFSLLTISIAWIFYRPLLGVGMIVVSFIFIGVLIGKLKSS